MNIFKKQLFSLFCIVSLAITLPSFSTEVSEKESSEQTEVIVTTPWYKTPKVQRVLIYAGIAAAVVVILLNSYLNYGPSIIDTEFGNKKTSPQ